MEMKFQLSYPDFDFSGRLHILGINRILNETAGYHSFQLGYAPEQLNPRGISWVLGKFIIRFEAPMPTTTDRFSNYYTVKTWRSGIKDIIAYRDYELFDDNNNTRLAVARADWILFDINKRVPLPLIDEIKNSYIDPIPPIVFDSSEFMSRIPIIDGEGDNRTTFKKDFTVNVSDIDGNLHANNLSYLRWILDPLPPEFLQKHQMVSMKITYAVEAKYNDNISTVIELTKSDNDNDNDNPITIHNIKRRADNKILTYASIKWNLR
ncbi:MAG: hypothetical protein HQK49_14625 [Oligoflexia bacterium]|nr:hypothetical protein [Oligoflexia bacterium]